MARQTPPVTARELVKPTPRKPDAFSTESAAAVNGRARVAAGASISNFCQITGIPHGKSEQLQVVRLPPLPFESATGEHIDLGSLACGWLVIYCYPGAPRQLAPESHLEDIRQHEAFAGRLLELRRRGVIVVALSSQSLYEQVDAMLALELRHRLLLDPRLSLAASLGLPSEDIDGSQYYCRQTLIVTEHRVEYCFCPVADAAANPGHVLAWMLAHGW